MYGSMEAGTERGKIALVEPKVYLVGEQRIDEDRLDEFLTDEGVAHWTTDTDVAGQKLAEVAGRLCYMSYAKPRPGGNTAYLHHIIETGHTSVLEHAVFNFLVTGVSRSFSHELVRHRIGMSYSQLSQRYVDESSCAFVEPDIIAQDDHLHGIFIEAMANARRSYEALASYITDKLLSQSPDMDKTERRKMARQAARAVLPGATETKLFVTMNARAARHFIHLRASPFADAEIRRVALGIYLILSERYPAFFSDCQVTESVVKVGCP